MRSPTTTGDFCDTTENSICLPAPTALRWAIDVGAWSPVGEDLGDEWRFLEALILEDDEREAIGRFALFPDRVRALISRLMARRCCSEALGLDHFDVRIDRTKGRKPFLTQKARSKAAVSLDECPNFNFNVSHEGRFVVLACEPNCVVGVDVAAPERYRRTRTNADAPPRDVEKFFETMRGVLAPSEWAYVKSAPDLDAQTERFRAFWSCKEAFTKARGDGIAFGLGRAEFSLLREEENQHTFQATVAVDGVLLDRWSFFGQSLDRGGHVVTVARGPPDDIVDANGDFKRTFSKDRLDKLEILAPHPDFVHLTVRDLVPPRLRSQYDAILARQSVQVTTLSASENPPHQT